MSVPEISRNMAKLLELAYAVTGDWAHDHFRPDSKTEADQLEDLVHFLLLSMINHYREESSK